MTIPDFSGQKGISNFMKLGIVGLPNVGKSTLFNALTNAGAESANYPFCTIEPNVGVVTVPDKRLGHLEAEFKSPAGVIKSAWKYEGETWIWTFTIPKGATAFVTLPGEKEGKDYEAGTYTVKL